MSWVGTCALIAACSKPDDLGLGDVDASLSAAQNGHGAPQPKPDAGAHVAAHPPAATSDAGAPHGSFRAPRNVSVGADGLFYCGQQLCQCNNGIDDDGDGKVDGDDVECTGALDDDEGSFSTGIPGDNRDPKWQDCFFDGNSGAGDDRCRYPTGCLTGAIAASDAACAVTETCRERCAPIAPQGCDCFGCCTVRLPNGGATHLLLTSSCTAEHLGDPQACVSCTPSDACQGENPYPPAPPTAPADAGSPPGSAPTPPTPPTPSPDPAPSPSATCDAQSACTGPSDCAISEPCIDGCCLAVIR
jgi:hypothetical protein